ncbi:MAG: Serine protease, subtilisin family [Chloroflexi bacterium AL-W]|nr:Serine protease, subtilisin family [Chloroflexi bacterium AL-W]
MYTRCVWLLPLVLFVLAIPPTFAQSDELCFPETGYCITGRIREFWQQNGALPVFGYPTGPQQEVLIEGQPFQAQSFERNRLELHSENAPPYDVLLGRLGVVRLEQQGRDWFAFPTSSEQPGCRFFPETGHNVCGDILAAWRANGLEFDGLAGKSEAENLALFGLPLSDVQTEEIQGQMYEVQWFERARFELHPENQPPFNVLLGLLGNEIRDNAEPPVETPPEAPPPLPEPSFNNCQADPFAEVAPNYPVRIVSIDKDKEIVQLQNLSPEPVSLDGWRMCSITGNQEHISISGVLAPDESRDFPYLGSGTIWNNSDQDDGALYNENGQLVSYFVD